jgi:putative transposase
MSDTSGRRPAPRLRFSQSDRIVIKGVEYTWRESSDEGHVFARVSDPALVESFTHEDLDRLRRLPDFRFGRGFYSPGTARARMRSGVEALADLPPHEQAVILWRLEYCRRFLRMEEAGETSRSDDVMEAAVAAIRAEVDALDVAQTVARNDAKRRAERARRASAEMDIGKAVRMGTKGKSPRSRQPRSGTALTLRQPPKGRTLLKWIKRLEDTGFNPLALRDGYYRCGSHDPLDAEVYRLMAKHVARFAQPNRPKKKRLYEDLRDEMEELNRGREAAGLEPLAIPSDKTFYKRFRKLDAFQLHLGQHGAEAAKRRYLMIGSGLDVVRPFQRVEIDEWSVSLMTLAVDTGIWERLSPEMREKIARERRSLFVAICAATRCIGAMHLASGPTGEAALATLQMLVSDKKHYADAVGALQPWDMEGTPEEIATDAGAAFLWQPFRTAVADIGSTLIYPPSGQPQMRSFVERSFGTIHTALISRFSGRTFENTVVRGDYDSEAQASLTVEQLCWALVRYVVDIYHNSPHGGLGGETPRAAWLRLTRLYPVIPSPDRHTRRAIFGIQRRAALSGRGVRFMGLHFQSEALQAHWRKVGDGSVEIRVDPMDLGHASVRLGKEWLAIPNARAGFDDVPLRDWMAASADLRRRFADAAKLSDPVVLEAVRAIRTMNASAMARAGISDMPPSAEQVDRAERALGLGFVLPDRGDGATPAQDTEVFGDIIPVTGGTDSADPAEGSTLGPPDGSSPPDDPWIIE